MEQNQKTFEKVIIPGAQHAFHNDTNPDRYHPEAAQLAWQRALKWLRCWPAIKVRLSGRANYRALTAHLASTLLHWPQSGNAPQDLSVIVI